MKKFTFFVLLLLCTLVSQAQIDTTRTDLANLFSALNTSMIPTGYLSDWGTDMADREDYNGVISDSNIFAFVRVFTNHLHENKKHKVIYFVLF